MQMTSNHENPLKTYSNEEVQALLLDAYRNQKGIRLLPKQLPLFTRPLIHTEKKAKSIFVLYEVYRLTKLGYAPIYLFESAQVIFNNSRSKLTLCIEIVDLSSYQAFLKSISEDSISGLRRLYSLEQR